MTKDSFWNTIRWPLFFVCILWMIEGVFVLFNIRLTNLGILPRTISGIPGIFFSPFIHGNYDHLLSNTLPLLVVGSGLVYFYNDIAGRVLMMIWLFTGFWVWLAARSEYHIGASGLIYGLVCFLFLSGVLRKDTRLLAVSLLVTFLYGSLVWGILPVDQSISWESHLFGSVAGIFCAIYYRHLGPQRQKAQWEIDEELEKTNEETMDTTDESHLNASEDINIRYDYKPKDEKN
jgi:membrane associated rhomboid family serine protease